MALARLARLRLIGKTPYLGFAFLLAAALLRDSLLAVIPYDSHAYTVAWEATLPFLLAAHCFASSSAYRSVAGLYPKIGRFAVWLFTASLAIAAVCCFATLPWEAARIGGNEALLRSLFLLHRWIDGLAAGGLVFACLLLSRFPAPLRRMPANLTRHIQLLACYFAIYSAVCLVENLAPIGAAVWMERATFCIVAILYGGWTFGLSAAGERVDRWPEMPPEVLAHLNARSDFAGELARHAAR